MKKQQEHGVESLNDPDLECPTLRYNRHKAMLWARWAKIVLNSDINKIRIKPPKGGLKGGN